MNTLLRSRGLSLVATAAAALVIAALIPASPAFADEDDPTTPVGSIAGVVTDPAGAPAEALCITAEVFDDAAWAPVDLGVEVRTDATGAYILTGLGTGTYAVSADSCTASTETLRTWAPSLAAQPAISDGTVAADGIVVSADSTTTADIQVLPAAVEALAAPTISGGAQFGATLTADHGIWSVKDLEFTYQWLRDGAPIVGAKGDTYVVTAEDIDATLSVAVTASRIGWEAATATSVESAPVTALPITSNTPTISGTAKVGQQLTAAGGAWSPVETVLSFEWLRNGDVISGAVASTYTLTAADLGTAISVRATGALAGHTTTTQTSAATALVASGTLTTATPKITGAVKVGSILTAAPGWTPSNIAYTYTWKRNGTAITGATKVTYTPTSADLGAKLTVTVRGALTGYTAVTLTSASTATVAVGTFVAPVPTVSGTVAVGRTVTAVPGTWKPGASFTYVWKRAGVPITGATKSTYPITATDLGKALTVTVTGTATAYTTASKTSTPVTVAAGTLTAPTPTIAGIRAVGRTLTAAPGTWSPSGVAFTYQWKRAGVSITGATASTYVLTAADLGKTLTVTTTGKKAAYSTLAKTSVATTAVAAGTLAASTPTISGTRTVGKTLTAAPGTWSPSGVALTYQWKRAGIAITGATKSTYVLTASDLGKSLTVIVTGKKAGYNALTKTSGAITNVVAGTMSLTAGVSGTAKVGYTVAATATAASGATLSYQWYRSGVLISGATGRTYNPSNSDIGKTLAVAITARKAGYATLTARSGATAAVRPPDSAPPISGTWNCPSWAPIKGNADSMIYHVPSGAYYTRTNPEECFSSESAAVNAGYRKSKL
ncbi:sunset domain-containing protein [Agromyces sp. Marseille-Q5079]|uniref:sunset domain-containing protein n=1 Tax=Agromyces sp. Marseille-Q5079 TaxID=3439059 RepID=UPI003D9C9B39